MANILGMSAMHIFVRFILIISLCKDMTSIQAFRNISTIHRRLRRDIEEDFCPNYYGHGKECRQAGCAYNCGDNRCSKKTECYPSSEKDAKCQDFCEDMCLCKTSGQCEYDEESGGCRPGARARYCPSNLFDQGECTRAGVYYSVAAKLCKNSVQRGNCYIDKTIRAVNFGGGPMVDSRGIYYQADSSELYADHNDIRLIRNQFKDIESIPEEDKDLYKTFLHSDPTKSTSGWCMSYWVHVCLDGKYELAIRVAEDEVNGPGQRKFSILFGEIAVFPEVDLFYLTNGKNRAADLYLNFEVTDGGTKLRMKGHPVVTIQKHNTKSIWLAFCNSFCDDATNRNFLLAGFSVARLSPTGRAESECLKHKSDPCACRYAGHCEFHVPTQQCIGRTNFCSYSCESGNTECRRSGPHVFYADGGVVCNSMENRGNCKIAKTLVAINFNAGAHTDSRGINYVIAKKIAVSDPYKVIRNDAASKGLDGVPAQDIGLYKGYIYGNSKVNISGANTSCVTYQLPTDGDGSYELSIKTGEFFHNISKFREFSVKFNKQYIVQEFEPMQYRRIPNQFELNVNFRIIAGGSKLVMKGHPTSSITNPHGNIPLQFCFGLCSWTRDRNWETGAFSLVKFSS